jgi:hypothetical protein
MTKHILTILIASVLSFLFIPFVAEGQRDYEDVVYLKNGSLIHGKIIEQIPDISIKIRTRDRNVFEYKMDEIDKITKETVYCHGRFTSRPRIAAVKQKGLINITELNICIVDFDRWERLPVACVQTSLGYLVNPCFSAGLATGIELLDREVYIPFIADLRYYVLKKTVTPFLSLGAGYSLGFSGGHKYFWGGLRINPKLGMKIFGSSHFAFNFSFGFNYQEYGYKYNYYYSDYSNGGNNPIQRLRERRVKGAHNLYVFSVGVTF